MPSACLFDKCKVRGHKYTLAINKQLDDIINSRKFVLKQRHEYCEVCSADNPTDFDANGRKEEADLTPAIEEYRKAYKLNKLKVGNRKPALISQEVLNRFKDAKVAEESELVRLRGEVAKQADAHNATLDILNETTKANEKIT